MTINEFLQWIMASGGATIIGSWIVERIPAFQILGSKIKEWVFFGVVSLIWVISYLILSFVPAEIIAMIEPWFMGISGLFVTVVVGKLFHKVDKVD